MEKSKENIITNFEELNLRENVLRGIYSYGFEKPSEIQSKAIKPIISGLDVIAQSQSGTGKTGTFVISALERIDESVEGVQGIIIAPTRELAIQIFDVCKNIGQYTKIKPVLCVGGSNIIDSRRELDRGVIVVIGTPGRIIDMIEKNFLSPRMVRILILDEADEMLSDSFLKQIRYIIEQLSNNTQICLFSATMPDEIVRITTHFMNHPQNILINPEMLTLEGIKQFYINIQQENWKFTTFCDLYDMISISQSMVYVNTKKKAEWLREKLMDKSFTVSMIHSDMKPCERSSIMKDFRAGGTRILISTDLLSRGIDIQQVSIVINYDLPNNKECYIHRIGRSGRFGRKGVAINFITNKEFWKIDELRTYYGTNIEPMPVNVNDFL